MIPIDEFIKSDSLCVLVRTDFKVDLDLIVDFFETNVKKYKKTYQGKKRHGGWSVQSNSGDMSDGWQAGGTPGITQEELLKLFPDGSKFQTPTPLYQGPMEKLIQDLNNKNFDAKRTRFADLEPNANCNWHVDGKRDKERYGFWRGHIAVKTNIDALFQFQSRDGNTVISYNIPADGYLYLANVNEMHRIENKGSESRIHILTDSRISINKFLTNVEPILSF